jgi:class 3 adenylate cyclase
MGPLLIGSLVLSLLGLPIAAWLDLRVLSERMLRNQAGEISRILDEVRAFYGSEVVGRVLPTITPVTVTHHYRDITGGIPVPATLSIELGQRISGDNDAVKYRFISDLPFNGREPHPMDDFERNALARLRADSSQPIVEVSGSWLERQVRTAAPVIMGPVCVSCHNMHPDGRKHDWKVGDVRGIQEISVVQPIASNIFSFKYLLSYFGFTAAAGLVMIVLQRRQTALIRGMNSELAEANDFLAGVSAKLAKYLSPQIYKSIFSGQKDVAIAAERKKLTIFFSDIKDFTALSERLQPEDLTALLNEYLTEMSAIALQHGGTVDKFFGDAILVFFGDPESKGVKEDARACLRMAVQMQRRLEELSAQWRQQGIERPFRARMGIHTGYCNVGNFGSNDRMDYTIVGAAANFAARLQSIAEPGGICLSYETYALVRDLVQAQPRDPVTVKGIGREIIPYMVKGLSGDLSQTTQVIREHTAGLDLFLDPNALTDSGIEQAKRRLTEALAALNLRTS